GSHQPDHGRAARVRAAGHAGRHGAGPYGAAGAQPGAVGGARFGGHLGRPRDRLLLDLPGGVLGHVAVVRAVRARADLAGGGALMLSHEFMRHAYLAGTFIALACGLVGYFLVLRSQVFAGDALSHVAFTGALAAVAAGIDVRLGLFAATIAVALG